MATTMTPMLMIYDRKRTAYRAAKCPRQSITYQPPTVGHRHQKSQQMQQQNAASHAYNVQSPTVTQNDSKLGIPRNFLGFFKITRDSEEYHGFNPFTAYKGCIHLQACLSYLNTNILVWTTLGPFQRPTEVSNWPKTAPKGPS